MQLSDILVIERTRCQVDGTSKKRLLMLASDLCSQHLYSNLDPKIVFECLIQRERLGSTAIGHGVAIPHGRVPHLEHAIGSFIQLNKGLDFHGIDEQPVDLIFTLIVPEEAEKEHLNLLSELATLFNQESVREKMRAAKTDEDLFKTLVASGR